MQIEYEATFPDIDKEEVVKKLKAVGAKLVKPEFLQKRYNFSLPGEPKIKDRWLRLRDEGDKITFSLKAEEGNKIEDQKEICLEVNNFAESKVFLEALGCQVKAYQETRRELWLLDDVEITIDEWPFLEPLIEVEGKSEEEVRKVVEKLGFNYQEAYFSSVASVYKEKYGISGDLIANQTSQLVFDMENPFISQK